MDRTCNKCGGTKPIERFPWAGGRDIHKFRKKSCYDCQAAYFRERRKADPEWAQRRRDDSRKWRLKNIFQIDADQYSAILQEQGGRCAICRREPEDRRLAIDHDHDTKRIRGLLCFRCNRALGLLNDDPAIFFAAATYLKDQSTQAA